MSAPAMREPVYVCEVCGRLAPITDFDGNKDLPECRPGWTHGRLIRVESVPDLPEVIRRLQAGER